MMKSDCLWKRIASLFVVVFATCSMAPRAIAAPSVGIESKEPTQQEDLVPVHGEAWVVSTRCVPACCPSGVGPESFSYRVSRSACSDWEQSDADVFFEGTSAHEPVIVFIHGNRTDGCEAVREGWSVYRRLQSDSTGQGFRFVIWSWPAEKVRGGPRKDALVKAARSDTQSIYLASWLDRLPPTTPVTLIGYSFGARVIGGALQVAEGGTLLGKALGKSGSDRTRRPVRVMLIAAAIDCEWLLPESRYGLAGQAVERMLITRNCHDRVLHLYPRMRRCDSSSALGATGPACPTRLAESGLAFETVPVECEVGKTHDWYRYLHSRAVCSRLAWYSFLIQESPSDN